MLKTLFQSKVQTCFVFERGWKGNDHKETYGFLKKEGFKGNLRFPLLDIQRHDILI